MLAGTMTFGEVCFRIVPTAPPRAHIGVRQRTGREPFGEKVENRSDQKNATSRDSSSSTANGAHEPLVAAGFQATRCPKVDPSHDFGCRVPRLVHLAPPPS